MSDKNKASEQYKMQNFVKGAVPAGHTHSNNSNGANMNAVPMMGMSKEEQEKKIAEFEKIKVKLEEIKKHILKKYNFTLALSLLPANSYMLFEEDEQMPKDIVDTRPMHVLMLIPEEQFKNIPKIKPEIIKIVKESKENFWVHIKTPVDLWNYGLDSKFELLDAVSASFPVHDKGLLGALRVASIHKTLVLRKFEKYVASYVIAGSLVRGTAGKDSDVDVFVVIDDTDVKRMPRIELLEKLRGMIYDYIREATALSGVKNILNVQVYLMTDFWQSVKDAHPIIFTFIRDGIPLHDRGTFIPWKLLLQMGKIKPSPEAIDLYMKEGERTEAMVKRRLVDAMVDIYYGIVTPTQAMMMMAGEAPPVPKAIVGEVKRVLVDRDKLMSNKELKILEKAVHLFKQYEYGKLKEYPGAAIDVFMKECQDYNKTLKGLREKLEKMLAKKTAEEVYSEVFRILRTILGNHNEKRLVKEFDDKIVKKGKIEPRFKKILLEISTISNKLKSKKLTQKEIDNLKKDSIELIRALIEYGQRSDLIKAEKGTIQVIYGSRRAELVLAGNESFIVEGRSIKKIKDGKFHESNTEEFEKALKESKTKLTNTVSADVLDVLKKELGKFEIVL